MQTRKVCRVNGEREFNEKYVVAGSRSRGDPVTPTATRAWVIASGPSSAMRGRKSIEDVTKCVRERKKTIASGHQWHQFTVQSRKNLFLYMMYYSTNTSQ